MELSAPCVVASDGILGFIKCHGSEQNTIRVGLAKFFQLTLPASESCLYVVQPRIGIADPLFDETLIFFQSVDVSSTGKSRLPADFQHTALIGPFEFPGPNI